MAKRSHGIRFLFILALFPILLLGSAGASAKNSGSYSIYLPLVMNTYGSWSTNFAAVTDLAAAGINAYDASAAIDTTNVNSGGKSIKIYGIIGSRGSCLNLDFGLRGFAGQNSMDLSEDRLSVEIYLPADSPIFDLEINVNRGSQYVSVRLAHDAMYRGQWHTYTVDLREDISLKTWRTYTWLTSPGLTDVQVVEVIKNVQSISIIGMVQKDHTPAESYFLVDRLGWESAGPTPAYDASVDSLWKYAPASLPIGGLMDPDGVMEPEYIHNFVQEFNATPGGGLFPATEPAGDGFAYDESWSPMPYADYFQEKKGFPLLRYSGIGETASWIPAWLLGKSYTQAQIILENFTHALVDHYKGKTAIWILFNELLRWDLNVGPYTGLGLKDRTQPQTGDFYSPWSDNSSDVTMIEDAFRVARAADPNANLIINEGYSSAEGIANGEALYNLVTKLKSDGTPIDGVGFEGHYILDQSGHFHETSPYSPVLAFDPVYGFTDIAANVERYAALGLKVAFTEVDVSIYVGDIDASTPAGQALLAQRRALQAAAYRSLLHIALTHPNVVFFNIFDWADEYAWTDPEIDWAHLPAGFGNDLGLFDWFYQKKPSYYAMLDELKTTQTPRPGLFNKLSPADSATDQPTAPTLSWEASTGATSYEVCLDTSNNNACDTSWISTGAGTSITPAGLLPLTAYFWQVRTGNASGLTHANKGAWGSFTTGSDWSTNFAAVTDLVAAGIFSPGNSLDIDTTNVNSDGKSIKIYGTIGQKDSQLNLNFGTWGLINQDSFDLSKKTIHYEIYLPEDSPLDALHFYIFNSNQYVVIVSVPASTHKGGWYTYSMDISQVITLKSWKAESWMTSSGLTDDEAVNLLKNAQCITIIGAISTDHTPAESYFLIDRLGWDASTP